MNNSLIKLIFVTLLNKQKYYFVKLSFIVLILNLSGCVKTNDNVASLPVIPFPQVQVNLGKNYEFKEYYSIKNRQIIKTVTNKDWDIAFSNNLSSKKQVLLNYGVNTFYQGINTFSTNFNNTLSILDYNRFLNLNKYSNYYDENDSLFNDNFYYESGILKSNKFIYIIQRGENSLNLNWKKIQILSFDENEVHILISNLDNSSRFDVKVPLNKTSNYTYFSFEKNSAVDIEPKKEDWDIEFTRYVQNVKQFDITQYYAVAGALLNPSKNIEVSRIENKAIENIKLQDVQNLNYSKSLYEIGYDWKNFSSASNDGFYSILPRVYAIKLNNEFYTLQFIETTKVIGNKRYNGYPLFLQNNL
jgi:hypothetical protein